MKKESLCLNGIWHLTYAEANQMSFAEEFSQIKPAVGRRMLEAEVPSPIHRVLQKNGLLDDPNYGMNSLKARWVEECFWIYRRTFNAPAAAVSGTAHLVFDRLEMIGQILLNGKEVGTTNNALYPARIDITGKLQEGENTLIVVLESGVFAYSDHYSKFNPVCPDTTWMTKRNFLRIWDGGIYMPREFFNACDKTGILIWHDFIYGCAKYPDEDQSFIKNICAEAEYIVSYLNNHPSMTVWCGRHLPKKLLSSQTRWMKS